MSRYGGMYRSRDGMVAGVLKGIAEYYDWSVFWMRAGFILLLILTGFFPMIPVYIAAALLMKKEPRGRWVNYA